MVPDTFICSLIKRSSICFAMRLNVSRCVSWRTVSCPIIFIWPSGRTEMAI